MALVNAGTLRGYYHMARESEPDAEKSYGRAHRAVLGVLGAGVFGLLDANDRLIERSNHGGHEVWDTGEWPWIARFEERTDDLRAEYENFARCHVIPQVAEVAGLDPSRGEGAAAAPVDAGVWRAQPVFAGGRWFKGVAEHFPVLRSCFDGATPASTVGFSVLGPSSHIAPHSDPNRGALRFQLPLMVPGSPSQCRTRIGSQTVGCVEGSATVFDISREHEAWNESDGWRVLLMAEIREPLRPPLSTVNWLAQKSLRWHPSYRHLGERVSELSDRTGAPLS